MLIIILKYMYIHIYIQIILVFSMLNNKIKKINKMENIEAKMKEDIM